MEESEFSEIEVNDSSRVIPLENTAWEYILGFIGLVCLIILILLFLFGFWVADHILSLRAGKPPRKKSRYT